MISSSPRPPSRWRRRFVLGLLLVLVVAPLAYLGVVRFVPPSGTPLMVVRWFQGESWRQNWVSIDDISPALLRAVVASEDSRFCSHSGFDWLEIRAVLRLVVFQGRMRGASTISMQTARNLMLWPGRDPLRKMLEILDTVLLEAVWPKRRILEVYMNIAEWGPGIYGVEAAAREAFGKSAAQVTEHEAALLAVVLPNPREWSAADPTLALHARAALVQARMRLVDLEPHHICP